MEKTLLDVRRFEAFRGRHAARRVGTSAFLLTAGAVVAGLALLAPPGELPGRALAGMRADDGGTALTAAAAGGAAWIVVGWLALSVLAALAMRLPGAAGDLGTAVARRITPAVIRQVAGGGVAVGLVLAPALAPAAASAATGVCPSVAVTAAPFPSLDRPLMPTCTTGPSLAAGPAVPASRTVSRTASNPVTAAVAATATAAVTVEPGDSLWSLARAQLVDAGQAASPAAVAARWPDWWAANRVEVGADPGLLHPGERLSAPAPSPS